LKPQRTIDYEVGYKQALNQSSALTISAFYREMRNLIQVIPVNYAYPVNYTTFGNIDFGTVKGLSVAYDLRRTGNVRLTANYAVNKVNEEVNKNKRRESEPQFGNKQTTGHKTPDSEYVDFVEIKDQE
jgi:outer membrane receptor protein involved in Fe transport